MGARSNFFTVKNLRIGIVVLIILLIVVPAIGLEDNKLQNAGQNAGWSFSSIIILLGIGALVAFVLYSVAKKKEEVFDWIPAKDRAMIEQLISAKDKEGIAIFLEFISLYGLTGYIKRLKLSGLPLLTVLLTLIFSILAALTWFVGLYFPNHAQDISAAAMDLAKLTLGAFIGSFVQRNFPEHETPPVMIAQHHLDHPAPPVPAVVPTPPDLAVVPTPPDPAVGRN